MPHLLSKTMINPPFQWWEGQKCRMIAGRSAMQMLKGLVGKANYLGKQNHQPTVSTVGRLEVWDNPG
jgi:hypothetical protein